VKILIIGADGQLGSALVKVLGNEELIPLTWEDIEICNFAQARDIICKEAPEIVINLAAFHQVDLCEDKIEEAFKTNVFAVRNLAKICRDLGIVLVHFSTDFVFGRDRSTPYREDDLPNPLSVYAASKLAGEYFVKNICSKHFLIRTCGLYGTGKSSKPHKNFVEIMLKLAADMKPIKVVNDQVLTPTYTKDLALAVAHLIKTNHYGLYHITNNGSCSWYEFAMAIFELAQIPVDLSPVTSSEFKTKAKRPAYSVLDNYNLRKVGLDDLRDWREALRDYLQARTQQISIPPLLHPSLFTSSLLPESNIKRD